jgi:type IV pilus assembly protein PilC
VIEFTYLARSKSGDLARGQLVAADEQAAQLELDSNGLVAIEIRSTHANDHGEGFDGTKTFGPLTATRPSTPSSLPLEVTLAALAEETNDPRLAKAAQRIADDVEHGKPIDQALADLDRGLPTAIRSLLQIGADTGDLAGVLERFSKQQLASQHARRRIRSALTYPLVIMSILVPLLLFLSLSVVPIFKDIFEEFDLPLPTVTTIIVQAAEQMPQFIIGLLILVVGIPLALRIFGGRWMFHRVRTAVPLLGRMWIWSAQRDFAAALASFVSLRVPLVDAVAQAGLTINDRSLGRACSRVSRQLESGASLTECLDQSIHFDRALVAIVAWGEGQGLLLEALALAIGVFDERIDQFAAFLRRLLPPITLVVVVTVMFYLLIGLMVPLVTLIQNLSL